MVGNSMLCSMKRIWIFLYFIFFYATLNAQYYSIGEDPSKIHWRQINTPDFQIVFPASFESKAQHLAAMLEKVYQYAGKTLNHSPHKISVILHTRLVSSNGLVSWAPARMELFTTPPQDTYAQDWLDQLAIHEFRHVVQIDKIDSELPNLFKILLGEQAGAAVVGVYLPLWLLEGDAVATETSLSHAGRGRLPSFEMELRAQVLEKGTYSYDKSYLGSYKDFVPDYYQLGYQMVTGARVKYGADIWGKVLHNVARNPLSVTPFSRGLKKNTGKNQKGLYTEIFNNLKENWIKEDNNLYKNTFNRITEKSKNYTDYSFPFYVNDSTFFAIKNSIDDQQRFVLITRNGKEKRIFTPGNILEKSLSVADNRIFWIENKPDPRWANQEFSLLRILNLNNGKLFEKRFKEKLFAPKLSFDGQYLACVKVDEKNNCSILLISPANGKFIKETPTPQNLFFITPVWSEKENVMYSVVLGKDGKSLVKFNPFSNEMNYLLPYSYNDLKDPVQKGNFVFFNSSQSGIDNVYAFDILKNKTFQVTSSRFGTQSPQLSAEGKKMVYCDYTAYGFSLVEISTEKVKKIEIDSSLIYENKLAREISEQENNIIPRVKDSLLYNSKKYSKIGHLFNIHSWAPFRIDTENEEIRPGFSVLSQNMLSTAITQVGYDYSTINNTGRWFAKFDYLGLLPDLSFNVDYGRGKSHYYQVTQYKDQQGRIIRIDTTLVGFSYKELNLNADVKIPLNLTHGKYIRILQPEFQAGFTNISLDRSVPRSIIHGTIIPLTYRLYASNYLTSGIRDLQPRFGQIMDLMYRNTPFGDNNYGSISSAEGTLFFPGLFKHHGIRIYGGYQVKNSNFSSFSDLINYPRGYQSIINDKLFSLRSDYILPLFYPDWSLGKLTYIKRISLRAFFDHGEAVIPANNREIMLFNSFNSLGTELTINCHFLRFIVPSTIGLRQSYLLESRKNIFEFLFSLNFNGFRTFQNNNGF